MPYDRVRSQASQSNGADTFFEFDKSLSQRLLSIGKAHGVTPFVLLVSAYQVLLMRYTGQENINVGTPITSRTSSETQGLVGLFINTLVLASDLAGNPTFLGLLQRNRKLAYGAFARQEIPYERIIEELRPARQLHYNLFFQTMVMFLDVNINGYLNVEGATVEPIELEKKTATFELTLTFAVVDEKIQLRLAYNKDLMSEAAVRRLLRNFQTLLNGIAEMPATRIGDLQLQSDAEESAALAFANGPIVDGQVGHWQSVPDAIVAMASRYPTRAAVRHRAECMEYAKLERTSAKLANALVSRGVQKGDRVALVVDRSLDQIAAVLGILRAGGVYVPIDSQYPLERIKYILDDSQAKLAIASNENLLKGVQCHTVNSLLLDADESPPSVQIHPEDLFYVIYTSGSTGRPKGVSVSHANVVQHCAVVKEKFGLDERDNVSQLTSIGFDVSAQEIFPALMCGASLVLWKDSQVSGIDELLSWIESESISVLNMTTAHWESLVLELDKDDLNVSACLRLVVVGGERVNPETLNSWCKRVRGSVRWINDYGLTETTVSAAMFECVAESFTSPVVPIGGPLPGVSMYVLDDSLRVQPVGVFGELFIGGKGIAAGYWNNPELTGDRFISNPFAPGRLFRTGDRARFREDGLVEFEGRRDGQVKIRGHRVELSEVEQGLTRIRGIRAARVRYLQFDGGRGSLIAYVVVDATCFTASAARDELLKVLPAHMVPTDFVAIDQIPLTTNGKLDESKLPTPTQEARPYIHVAPTTQMERVVSGSCMAALGFTRDIGVNEGFFDLGGDSLIAIKFIGDLGRKIGLKIPLRLLFEYPTLKDFASKLEELANGLENPPDACVVGFRRSGTKTPLFYIHPVGGTVSCYLSLARALGDDQPFFAIQSHGMMSSNSPFTTVESMAEYYLEEVKKIQPHGPYRLGGWSLGGFIAYEMAKRLQEQGECVEQLSLVDTYLTKVRVADRKTILYNFVLQLAAVPGKSISTEALKAWESRDFDFSDVCNEIKAYGLVPKDTPIEEIERLVRVYELTVGAFKTYDPQPQKKLKVPRTVLFRAQDSHEELGVWTRLVEDVELHHIEADHFGIINNDKIAEIINLKN